MDDVPCAFGTYTSQRYHWGDIIRIIADVEGIEDYTTLSQGKRWELVTYITSFGSAGRPATTNAPNAWSSTRR